MIAKLFPFLFAAGAMVIWWLVASWQSGSALRRQSRPLQNDQLDALTGRLAEAAGVPRVQVRLLDSPAPNGLATPRGEIYLTSGLFKHYQSGRLTGPEIASVVAHELGHLALGHTKRRVVDVAGAQIAHFVLGGLLSRIIPGLGILLARYLSSLFVAALSRKDEFEADAYATALMIKSGFGEGPQIAMLEKLRSILPRDAVAPGGTSWLSSHPAVEERTDAIRQNAARWNGAGVS